MNKQLSLHSFERLDQLKEVVKDLVEIDVNPGNCLYFADLIVRLVAKKYGFKEKTGLSYARSLTRQWYDDEWETWRKIGGEA